MSAKLIIGGHRGNGCTDHAFYHLRGADEIIATENTLLSFEQAFDAGADYIETDVVMSADGVLFMLHNVKPEDHFFATNKPATLLNQLNYAEISGHKTGHQHNGKITTLADTLEKIATLDPKSADWAINIELKGVQGSNQPYEANDFLARIAQIVRNSSLPAERILFSSFALENIIRMSQLLPQAKYGMLFAEQPTLRPIYTDTNERLQLNYLPFTSKITHQVLAYWQKNTEATLGYLHPEITTVKQDMISQAAQLGVGLNVWAYMEELDDDRKAIYAAFIEQAHKASIKFSIITDYISAYR